MTAGWHMSKKHWNTVALNTGNISDDFVVFNVFASTYKSFC
ncbi:MmcQ/YjbR family DNA-binding protein [Polaribacter sp.]|nr:MmcQ/YjbR family DNA-binding protein [Polaribacter sp.]